MDRRTFFALAVFAVLFLYLGLVYAIVSPFLRALGWAAVIGILTYPVFRRLRRRLGGRQTLAASVMTPTVVLTLVLPVLGLVIVLTQELTQIFAYLQEMSEGEGVALFENIRRHPVFGPWISSLYDLLARFGIEPKKSLVPAVEKVTAFALGYTTEIIRNFFIFCIQLIMMVFTLFFIYRDGERIEEQFWSIIPLHEEHKLSLSGTIKRVLNAVIFGILLTCAVQGVLGGLGFWFCGLPSPILFGSLMAVAALVPVVGTALIWLPGAMILILQGDESQGVILLIWGILVVSSIDNIIRPLFISGKGHLPMLVVAVGALGGLVSFGLIGVVLGPLVLSLFVVIFDIYKAQVFPHTDPPE